MLKKNIKNFIEDRSGSTAVEFALVAIGFLTFVFGIFEAGRIYWSWNTLQYAVENTTRYALTHEDAEEEELQDYVRSQMPGMSTDAGNPDIAVSWEEASGVNFIKITAVYDFDVITSFLPEKWNTLDLSATSRLPVP
jgi:Flp pilus assembly protein TadG